jgi:hypothetical protein
METPLLEISFGKSTSAYYERAVALAQLLPGYHRSSAGSNLLHGLDWTGSLANAGAWEQLEELLQLIGGWNSTRLKVAGREMHYARLAGYLNHIRTCYARKLRRGAGDDYCSGKSTPTDEASYFGCRCCYGVARQVDALTSEGTSWIRYGTLTRKRDAFRVDKQAILKALNQDSRTAACKLCPAFRWQRVCADVDELPELIKLGPQSLFQVRYAAFNPDHALGIEPKAPPVFSAQRPQGPLHGYRRPRCCSGTAQERRGAAPQSRGLLRGFACPAAKRHHPLWAARQWQDLASQGGGQRE